VLSTDPSIIVLFPFIRI